MRPQFPDLDGDAPELSATDLKRQLDSGQKVTLLDTRRPEDFEAWRITHPNLTAVNVPFTATLGDLRGRLRAFEEPREVFVDRLLDDLPPRPANFERIIAINLGQESASDEEAFELELGPNNCAVSE